MSIYIGNLTDEVTRKDLERVFSEYGKVNRVKLPSETEIREIKGVFFVEMAKKADEDTAIEALNGAELMGSYVRVNKAQDGEQSNLSGRGITGHFN